MKHDYYDEKGNHIIEDNGWLFINGFCVAEPMTDADSDRYAVDVMNGNGYYSDSGKYISYGVYDYD